MVAEEPLAFFGQGPSKHVALTPPVPGSARQQQAMPGILSLGSLKIGRLVLPETCTPLTQTARSSGELLFTPQLFSLAFLQNKPFKQSSREPCKASFLQL